MNAYSSGNFTTVNPTEPSLYIVIGSCLLLPLLAGSLLDTSTTQLVGVQNCSFKDGETKCVLFKQTVSGWIRELGRCLFQIAHVVIAVVLLQAYAPVYAKSLLVNHYGILGLAGFLVTQSDFFEDFRRLLNSLIFKIKHN
jgi:hypothetical protein